MSAGVEPDVLNQREAALLAALPDMVSGPNPWRVAAEMLPHLAAMLGARRAFLAEVVQERLRSVGIWRAPGVEPGPYLGESMKAVRAAAGAGCGTVVMTAQGPVAPELEDVQRMMRLRGVHALVMALPDDGDDAVVMAFEVPSLTARHVQRDAAIIGAFARSLSGILALRERTDRAERAAHVLGLLEEISGHSGDPDDATRLRRALEMVHGGIGARDVILAQMHDDALVVIDCVGGCEAWDLSPEGLGAWFSGDLPLPLSWRVHGVRHQAHRIRVDGEPWGALVLVGIGEVGGTTSGADDAARAAALDQELATAAAGWIGGEISRAGAVQRLRWREEDLAALAERQHGIGEARRQDIARSLNDDVGQDLAAGAIELDLLIAEANQIGAHSCAQRLTGLREMQGQAIAALRLIASRLRPALLDSDGLVAAVRFESERLALRTPLHVELSLDDIAPEREARVRDDAFRILEEALDNVARHASAERVRVSLHDDGAFLVLDVEDDGVGIAARAPGESRLGILAMCERARRHGGTLSIDRMAPRGTHLHARLPLA